MKRSPLALSLLALVAVVGRAASQQSVIDAAGPQAGRIETLWWFLLALLGAIFITVIAVTFWAVMRNPRGLEQIDRTHVPSGDTESRLTRTVTAAGVATVLILLLILVVSVSTGKAVSELGPKDRGMVVEVTGNQWWWSVRYLNDEASRIVLTANEIHIPVGRPVMIRGNSTDVIHSFWVPNLHGKIDLIPSRVTTLWIEADHPGEFRGQCAEFCGLQHAHMALWVIAEPEDKFQQWMERQLQPAVAPVDEIKMRGEQVFLNNACVYCHSIRGTAAAGQVAPDLTHVGSRKTIAAGALPNNKGSLAGWIVDPQTIKPGNHMATINLPAKEIQPLVEYLESLK